MTETGLNDIVCCTCKKICDDQGYWNQIETYIKQHSSATFSHGYCHECAVKFYEECGLEVPDELLSEAKKRDWQNMLKIRKAGCGQFSL